MLPVREMGEAWGGRNVWVKQELVYLFMCYLVLVRTWNHGQFSRKIQFNKLDSCMDEKYS